MMGLQRPGLSRSACVGTIAAGGFQGGGTRVVYHQGAGERTRVHSQCCWACGGKMLEQRHLSEVPGSLQRLHLADEILA